MFQKFYNLKGFTMRNIYILLLIGVSLLLSTYAYAQSTIPAIQPVSIGIAQSVPMSAIVAIDGVTTTVPMTMNVHLTIDIESPVSVTVGSAITPTVKVAPGSVDDLGIPFSIETNDDDVEITEWTAYKNQSGELVFAGRIHLDENSESVEDILGDIRLYGKDGELMHMDSILNLAYYLDPGGINQFTAPMYIEPQDVGHYEVSIEVIR